MCKVAALLCCTVVFCNDLILVSLETYIYALYSSTFQLLWKWISSSSKLYALLIIIVLYCTVLLWNAKRCTFLLQLSQVKSIQVGSKEDDDDDDGKSSCKWVERQIGAESSFCPPVFCTRESWARIHISNWTQNLSQMTMMMMMMMMAMAIAKSSQVKDTVGMDLSSSSMFQSPPSS